MKQIGSIVLAILLLFVLLPTPTQAVTPLTAPAETAVPFEGSDPAETVEYDSFAYQQTPMAEPAALTESVSASASFTYKPMTSSQKLLDLIKDCEGFSATPYWDVSHYAIGYGTGCGSSREDVPAEYWDGISEAKGQELLMDYLENTAEEEVNRFFRKIGRQPLQQQFDAMVDFTYALGGSWMYEDSRVAAWLTNPTTSELDLVRALGAWCRVNGKVSTTTCSRRIREALIYLYGLYLLPYGNVDSELDVVSNADLPMFKYVIFEGNGTTLINSRTDDINYFYAGGTYSGLGVPERSGYTFSGWQRSDGSLLLDGHRVNENLRVKATWTKIPFKDIEGGQWYTAPVAYCYREGIMNGAYPTVFQPHTPASRAMVVTVLYRMAGEPKVTGSSGMTDVKAGEYYEKAVTWAIKQGIATGYPGKTFRPDQAVTRAELVTFLYRYAVKVLKADVSASNQLGRFKDSKSVPDYAEAPFNWALARGLVNGTSTTENRLSPLDNSTRAQLAKMLMALDNLE